MRINGICTFTYYVQGKYAILSTNWNRTLLFQVAFYDYSQPCRIFTMLQSGFLLQFLLCYLVFALGNDQACVHMKENKKVDIDETCKTVPCLIKCCPESQILFDNGTELHCATTSYLEMTYNVSNLEDYSDLEIYNADIKREIIKTNKRINNFTILNYKNFSLCNSNEIFVMQPILVPHVLEVGKF